MSRSRSFRWYGSSGLRRPISGASSTAVGVLVRQRTYLFHLDRACPLWTHNSIEQHGAVTNAPRAVIDRLCLIHHSSEWWPHDSRHFRILMPRLQKTEPRNLKNILTPKQASSARRPPPHVPTRVRHCCCCPAGAQRYVPCPLPLVSCLYQYLYRDRSPVKAEHRVELNNGHWRFLHLGIVADNTTRLWTSCQPYAWCVKLRPHMARLLTMFDETTSVICDSCLPGRQLAELAMFLFISLGKTRTACSSCLSHQSTVRKVSLTETRYVIYI